MLKRKKISIFFIVLLLVSFSLAFFTRKLYVVPILMYHSINPVAPTNNRLVVSVKSFERQMNFLKRHGYNVVTLETIASIIRDRKKIPPKTLVITFDDGYRDNYTYAFPVLKKYNLPTTMFIIIDEVGRPQADRLSWEEIMTMRDSGIITFGSHSLGPEPLTNIQSEAEQKRQIFDSKKILEEKLGREIKAFSYPEGIFNNNIKRLVMEAGYKVAVATNPGKRSPNNDIFALKRIRISSTSDNLFVFWIESNGYYTFIKEHRDD